MQKEIALLAHSENTVIDKDASLFEARMVALASKSAAVIVENQKPIAIITRRDILALMNGGVNFEERALSYAKKELIKADKSRDVEYALHLMINHDIRRVVVVDDVGTYIGIVTQDDLMFEFNERAYYAELKAVHLLGGESDFVFVKEDVGAKELLSKIVSKKNTAALVVDEFKKPIGIVTESTLLGLCFESLDELRLKDIMSSPVDCIRLNASISEIINEMKDRNYRHLAVLDEDGAAVGIIDSRNILQNIEGSFGQFLQKKLKTARDAIDTLPQAVIEAVNDGGEYRVQWVNERAKTIFGQGLVDKRLGDVVEKKYWLEMAANTPKTTHQNPVLTSIGEKYFEICALYSDGERLQISLSDVTHILKVQKELESKKESEAEAKLRFEFAKKAAGIGVWDYNIQTKELVWDEGMREIFGIKEGPITYQSWRGALLEEDLADVEMALFESIENKKHFQTNFRIVRDGEIRYIQGQAEVICENAKAQRVVGVNLDITEQKTLEIALQESEKALKVERNLFVGGPVVVFKWSGKEGWPVEYVSANVKDILGIEAQTLVSGEIVFSQLIHQDDIDTVTQEVVGYIAERKKSFDQEYRLLGPAGEYRWFHDFTVMEYGDDGSLEHINGYLIDITDKKTAERKVAAIKESLDRGQSVAHLGSWDLDLESDTLWWSDEIYRIFGLLPQEFCATYEAFLEMIHPDDLDAVKKAVDDSIKNKTDYKIVHRIVLKSGEEKTVLERGETYYDKNGKAIRMIGVIHDITEQVESEKRLKLREKQLAAIVENLPVGIFFATPRDGIILSNKAGNDIWGASLPSIHLSLNEFKAWSYEDKKMLKPEEWGVYKSLSYGEKTINRKLQIECFDGSSKIILETSIPIFDDDAKVSGAIAINEDITDREAYEKSLMEAKIEADAANRAKSEFLANMSHEIRTPMNAVLGFAELLKNEDLDGKRRGFVDGIILSGRNLLGLINDILDLSKLEAGKMRIVPEATNLGKIIKELQVIFEMKAKEKGITYDVQIRGDMPQTLLLDETRVRQILFNLIGNAIKFTDNGGVRLGVDFCSSKEIDGAVDISISVCDTGIGIPDAQKDEIFGAFHQMDGQSTRKYGGTGLGLAISKKLADMMGAKLELNSVEGEGSVFTLILQNVESAMMEDEGESCAAVTLTGGKILLVEDVSTNREVVRGFLSSHGVAVYEAQNGLVGVEMAKKYHPDVILMDMQMPVMDGYKATRLLKDDPDTTDIAIIALTASVMGDRGEEVRAMCDGYLQKPIASHILISELARFLPHEFVSKPSPQRGGIFSFEACEADIIRGLLEAEWLKASRLKSNDEIEEFARRSKETAKQISSEALMGYANALLEACESFRVKDINRLFDSFEEIIRIKK